MSISWSELKKRTTTDRVLITMGLKRDPDRRKSNHMSRAVFQFVRHYAGMTIKPDDPNEMINKITRSKRVLHTMQNNEHLSISGNAYIFNDTEIMIFGDFTILEIHPEYYENYGFSADQHVQVGDVVTTTAYESYPDIVFRLVCNESAKCMIHTELIDICLKAGGNGRALHIDGANRLKTLHISNDGSGDGEIPGFIFTNMDRLTHLFINDMDIESFSNVDLSVERLMFNGCTIRDMQNNKFRNPKLIKIELIDCELGVRMKKYKGKPFKAVHYNEITEAYTAVGKKVNPSFLNSISNNEFIWSVDQLSDP